MRATPRQIVRFVVLILSTAAFWSMGPIGKSFPESKPALAGPAPVGPIQIDRLGQGLALETCYDVASSAKVSASGYGGPGHSGGAGDELVRLLNVGNFGTPTAVVSPVGVGNSGVQPDSVAGIVGLQTNGVAGALCANVYVFDDDQELQECCSCFISADGVRTFSVTNDLISNPAFNGARMSLGAIKVVGSFGICSSPTTAAGLTPIVAGPVGADPFAIGGFRLAEGLKGWISHAEAIASNLPPSFAFVTSTSVDELANAPLDSSELIELTTNCAANVRQASGAGICTRGSGENVPPPVLPPVRPGLAG